MPPKDDRRLLRRDGIALHMTKIRRFQKMSFMGSGRMNNLVPK